MRENTQKTKEEWTDLFALHHTSGNVSRGIEQYHTMLNELMERSMTLSDTENCFGDYLSNCKNLQYCFDVVESENCKYVTYAAFGAKDVYDSNAL